MTDKPPRTRTHRAKQAEPPEWTGQQRLFVHEYLVDLNATQAAIRAGYSARSAAQIGQSLMLKPEIKTAIETRIAERAEKAGLTSDGVLNELRRVVHSDVRRIFTRDGALLRPHEMTDDVAGSVASIEVVTVARGEGEVEHVAKIKLTDKVRGIELAGRYLGLWKDKGAETGGVTVIFGE